MLPRLQAAVVVLAVVMAGCASPTGQEAEPVTVEEGFEDGIGPWEEASEVPDDPNRPGQKVAWNITITDDQVRTGEASAWYQLDGSQDDGTIWLVREVEIAPGQMWNVEAQAYAWSGSESFNHIADLVLYVGNNAPQAEDDFRRGEEGSPGMAEGQQAASIREPLNQRDGWKRYGFNATLSEIQSDTMHVAVGISVVWETEVDYAVDDLRIRLTPFQEGVDFEAPPG